MKEKDAVESMALWVERIEEHVAESEKRLDELLGPQLRLESRVTDHPPAMGIVGILLERLSDLAGRTAEINQGLAILLSKLDRDARG